MATSGTTTFNLDAVELIEEAYERAGLESRGGYDLRTARRSLNIMSLEWANRGLNLWTIEERSVSLVGGQADYTLGTDVLDLVEHVVRESSGQEQIDYVITRISLPTYATRSSKNTQARPTEIYIDRQREAPIVTFWPVPDSDIYTMVYWVIWRMQDAGDYTNTLDIPVFFLPAMTAGLAFYLAMKRPALADRLPMLKGEYDRQFDLAAHENREKAALTITPRKTRVV